MWLDMLCSFIDFTDEAFYYFIRVGGETRSHRSAGSNTPVLAPGEPEP